MFWSCVYAEDAVKLMKSVDEIKAIDLDIAVKHCFILVIILLRSTLLRVTQQNGAMLSFRNMYRVTTTTHHFHM